MRQLYGTRLNLSPTPIVSLKQIRRWRDIEGRKPSPVFRYFSTNGTTVKHVPEQPYTINVTLLCGTILGGDETAVASQEDVNDSNRSMGWTDAYTPALEVILLML